MEKFKLKLDKDGFIIDFILVFNDDYDVLSDSETMCGKLNGYTKFINGEFVEDAEKKAEILKEKEIIQLEKNLEDTSDYVNETFEKIVSLDSNVTFIVDFLKIIRDFRSDYAKILSDRKTWRDRLKELRGE